MKPPECERSWEVEALRDGRLGDASHERVHGHANVCAVCREKADLQRELIAALAAGDEGLDELALRRLRARVMRDADARLRRAPEASTGAGASRRRTAVVAMVGAAVVGVAALFGIATFRHADVRPNAADDGSRRTMTVRRAMIDASADAVWRRTLVDGLDRVVLSRGVLQIRVDRAHGDAKVRVVTPDGIVDDIGTSFVVEVRDTHMRSVQVSEGRVAISFTDGRRVELGAGEAWQATPETVVVNARPALEATVAPIRPQTHAGQGDPTQPREARGERQDDPESGEDADYLAVVAAERAGDSATGRRAAQAYLARHPHGFRRLEVEALLRSEHNAPIR